MIADYIWKSKAISRLFRHCSYMCKENIDRSVPINQYIYLVLTRWRFRTLESTFVTIPLGLRDVFRSHQRSLYI